MRGTGQPEIRWPPTAASDKAGSCSGAWHRGRYRECVLLRDGRSALLRPAHFGDAALLQTFIAELSPRSRLLRFHGAVSGLSDADARTMSTQVASRHVALLALAPRRCGLPELCAEARYAVDEDLGRNEVEFGIAVADGWQRLGLARALLTRLAIHARASGFSHLCGSVMAGNGPMLALLQVLGAELRVDGNEVRGTIAL